MNKYMLLLAGSVLLLTCCNGFKQGPADMRYLIHRDQPGKTIQTGDFLSVHFIHRTQEGVLLASSYETGHPLFFEQQKPFFRGDIFTGLAFLSEGDSATFLLNFDSMQIILNVPKPPHAKGKYLSFTVKVEKVIPRLNMPDSLFQQKVNEFLSNNSASDRLQEPGKISRYITANKLKPAVTSSGLQYVIIKNGDGSPARPGDTVQFDYTGRYITGKVFDTSIEDTARQTGIFTEQRSYIPDSAVAGSPKTIPAIDEALLLFPSGTHALLIIPSRLAYGETGNSLFPPFTPLIFNLEVKTISKRGHSTKTK
ncbi:MULTISPECIES: FKBP-type peptidyl-prolyl cis-trans isomerase [Niastella]|uniref:Peptidyl-prolyl cis-trans isomerase n=1 Tax=Niastella soli TaxID=2821487 RepID=A0ABS3YXC4_9BACT|nr:FKBP-type peptidyl-prolyl cis-trans isomerase [Niastella soli]MBO9202579.1 FKBP-type peptidyl-prolyl cis-trans isomerase [Niastella soli]